MLDGLYYYKSINENRLFKLPTILIIELFIVDIRSVPCIIITNFIDESLIKSDGGNRPDEVQQP